MTAVYIGLGSNMGDREGHLAHALRRLDTDVGVAAVSSVYETDPVGYTDQSPFLNMVARLDTGGEPQELMRLIRRIEAERDRQRKFRNAPRTLDIDILLFGDRVLDSARLTIPHPRMTDRAFVLVPLLELDPELAEPGTGVPYRDHLPSETAGVRRIMSGDGLLDRGSHGPKG